MPAPDVAAAIQLSVARINDAVIHGRLDLRKATSLFNGLRIASRFIPRSGYPDPDEVVQSAQQTATGEELAPHTYICDDGEDCDECFYKNQCTRSIKPGDPDYEEEGDEDDD